MEDDDKIVKVSCPYCDRVLFEGSEYDRRHMIIYCERCL